VEATDASVAPNEERRRRKRRRKWFEEQRTEHADTNARVGRIGTRRPFTHAASPVAVATPPHIIIVTRHPFTRPSGPAAAIE
jgi:hypothetical protein